MSKKYILITRDMPAHAVLAFWGVPRSRCVVVSNVNKSGLYGLDLQGMKILTSKPPYDITKAPVVPHDRGKALAIRAQLIAGTYDA